MRESIKPFRAGQTVSATQLARMTRVANRHGRFAASGINGSSLGHSQAPAFEQQHLIVTGTGSSDIYPVKVRQFNHLTGDWETNDSAIYSFDASELGVSFKQDDKTTGYWHPSRGMYLPVSLGPGETPPSVFGTKTNILWGPRWFGVNSQQFITEGDFHTTIDTINAGGGILRFKHRAGPDIGLVIQDNGIAYITRSGIYRVDLFLTYRMGRDTVDSSFIEPGNVEQASVPDEYWLYGTCSISSSTPSWQGFNQIQATRAEISTRVAGPGTGPQAGETPGTFTAWHPQQTVYSNYFFSFFPSPPRFAIFEFTFDATKFTSSDFLEPYQEGYGFEIYNPVVKVTRFDDQPNPNDLRSLPT